MDCLISELSIYHKNKTKLHQRINHHLLQIFCLPVAYEQTCF